MTFGAAAKNVIKRTPLLYRLGRLVVERRRRRREAATWTAPYLTPAEKVSELRRYAKRFGSKVFVETGTYEGETTYSLRRDFHRLYTIELDPDLARLARLRFARHQNVTGIEGTGPDGLRSVLGELTAPALFWLDSHPCSTKTSGSGSPAVDELRQVMGHQVSGHIALIDDVRLLTGENGWPTLDEVLAAVDPLRFETEIRDDILRVTPKRSGGAG